MEEYCLYLRKSRADMEAESRGEGDTLKRHREALLRLAKQREYIVTEIYHEVVSGETIAARPEMQRMLADVELGRYTGVLVMEVERLARGDTIDQGIVSQAFKYSETKIVTPTKTYDPNNEFDEEYFEFGLFMSRREYKAINRRIQRGRVASVMEGKWPANKAPYGYIRSKLEHEKGFTLIADPNTAEIVRSIFNWYTTPHEQPDGAIQRLGVDLIVRRLNELGIPSATGKDWTPAVVREMLHNPSYAGFVRWGYRPAKRTVVNGEIRISTPIAPKEKVALCRGRHKPLVSEETFALAQQYLSHSHSRPGPKQVSMQNPLSSLVFCSGCGHAMVRRPYQSGRMESLICPHTSCSIVASDLSTVEAAILDGLRQWLNDFELNYPTLPQDNNIASFYGALTILAKEQLQLEAQKERSYNLVEQGIYSTEEFVLRNRSITNRLTAIEQHKEKLLKEVEKLEAATKRKKEITPQVRYVLDAYPYAQTPQEKNELLKSVLLKVAYSKTQRNRSKEGGDLSILLYPKLPASAPSHM